MLFKVNVNLKILMEKRKLAYYVSHILRCYFFISITTYTHTNILARASQRVNNNFFKNVKKNTKSIENILSVLGLKVMSDPSFLCLATKIFKLSLKYS
jgi:hypothetical protein